MTRINLLPWREAERKERKRQFASIAIGAVFLMAAIIFYVHLHINGMIDNQNTRNKFLTNEIAIVDKSIDEIRELESNKKQLLNRMNIIQDLQGRRPLIVHILDELVRTLPEGLYLTELNQQGNSLELKGVAQSNARVSALMRRLDKSPWFNSPKLDVIQSKEKESGEGRTSHFALTVNQRSVESDEQAE